MLILLGIGSIIIGAVLIGLGSSKKWWKKGESFEQRLFLFNYRKSV